MHFNFKLHILNFAKFDRYLSKVVVSLYSPTKIVQSVASLYPGQHSVIKYFSNWQADNERKLFSCSFSFHLIIVSEGRK